MEGVVDIVWLLLQIYILPFSVLLSAQEVDL